MVSRSVLGVPGYFNFLFSKKAPYSTLHVVMSTRQDLPDFGLVSSTSLYPIRDPNRVEYESVVEDSSTRGTIGRRLQTDGNCDKVFWYA